VRNATGNELHLTKKDLKIASAYRARQYKKAKAERKDNSFKNLNIKITNA